MGANDTVKRKDKILMGVYSLSVGMAMIALSVVVILEIGMLVDTVVDPSLFGAFIGRYRAFYISLLSVAVVSIILNLYVRRDIERRYKILRISNPLCAVFFFAWSLGITYSDITAAGVVDPAVFMTFSLIIPLIFFMFPLLYAGIVIVADAFMLYFTVVYSGATGPLINLAIFFIFQFVLGLSFLRLKMSLSERIVKEQENAEIDVLTGFANRRAYEKDIVWIEGDPQWANLAYVAIDLNELKETNDRHGHDAGDKIIVGVARCIEECFGETGRTYRIGGDEFVVLIPAEHGGVEKKVAEFPESMAAWSEENGLNLSAAIGYVLRAEYPYSDMAEIAKMADERMYADKARYYQAIGRDRRKRLAAESEFAESAQPAAEGE